jgi:hypothetical protein
VFDDANVFEKWFEWAMPRMEHDAVRIRMAPQHDLLADGDKIEDFLERAGFVRREMLGYWATLVVHIGEPEDVVFNSFRRQTRQAIRKCQRVGMEVLVDDTRAGRAVFAKLVQEMAEYTPHLEVFSEPALERASVSHFSGGME